MAAANLLALLDDIASALDDVATMTKVAAKKTAGVVGDDLALNAQQVTGVTTERELPVVWAVAKGSTVNKAILIPSALLISQFTPWLITPLLMAGGIFLCFEGMEKVAEKFFHPKDKTQAAPKAESESVRVRGAIRTDFILSAEIIVITLGAVAGATLQQQILVLMAIGMGMTIGVYGLVAMIVKADDLGLHLMKRGGFRKTLGRLLVQSMPYFMKFLGVAGTLAMFLVGGGILTHGIPWLHHLTSEMGAALGTGMDLVVGVLAGSLVLLALKLGKSVCGRFTRA